jgi:carbonic anhydrase
MPDEPASVVRADFEAHESALTELFETYHAWTVEQVCREFDTEYDVEEVIAEDLHYLADAPDPHLFLAVSDGEPAGCVFLRPMTETATEVKRLYVDPGHRGHGLGRALMEAAIDAATDAGFETLRLNAGPYVTAAQALYADLGFERTDPYPGVEIPEEYHDPWTFMELSLQG